MDEHGFDFNNAPQEPARVVTAVLPHPIHGRLIERVIPLVRGYLSFRGAPYKLCWRDRGIAYYTPLS